MSDPAPPPVYHATPPTGFHTVTPYLTCRGAEAAIDFYAEAFGAVETLRLTGPDGRLGHAEVRIGDCIVMLSDEFSEWDALGPETRGGPTSAMMIYMTDPDAAYARALAAGAAPLRPVEDHFYGERSGQVRDPFGHKWILAKRIEEVSPAEMQRRYDAAMSEE